jgi:hypothetical protein
MRGGGDVAARQEPYQLLRDGLVENRGHQLRGRVDVCDRQRVAQRRDIVVEEHRDTGLLTGQRLAQLLVARSNEVQHLAPALEQGGADAARHVGVTDDEVWRAAHLMCG